MRRKIVDPLNNQIEVLKVPWYPQQDIEWTCLVNSIKMCLEYMKNTYDNRIIRDIVPNMSIDEIMKITNTRRFTGTVVDSHLIRNLNSNIEAGVIIGITENDIIINNPWLGSEYFISHEVFAPAWELEYNQAILLDPNPQSKLGREEK